MRASSCSTHLLIYKSLNLMIKEKSVHNSVDGHTTRPESTKSRCDGVQGRKSDHHHLVASRRILILLGLSKLWSGSMPGPCGMHGACKVGLVDRSSCHANNLFGQLLGEVGDRPIDRVPSLFYSLSLVHTCEQSSRQKRSICQKPEGIHSVARRREYLV